MILFSLCKLASRNLPRLPRSLRHRLRGLRRDFLPTDRERETAYLGAAEGLHDLEFRIKELDRAGRGARGPFCRL